MSNTEMLMESLSLYISQRLDNGELIEDIIDDLNLIVEEVSDAWFKKYPIN
jgi:hypothetical protein